MDKNQEGLIRIAIVSNVLTFASYIYLRLANVNSPGSYTIPLFWWPVIWFFTLIFAINFSLKLY
ncbi:MAG: hypothetical protein NWP83_05760, partial [Spirosomaceae bacterium]|nr:hypothetical protein [Spirosomataceae bacterium]